MFRFKLLAFVFTSVLLASCGTTVPLDEGRSVSSVADQSALRGSSNNKSVEGGNSSTSQIRGTQQAQDTGSSASDKSGVLKNGIVYFDFDSYVIKPEFQKYLETYAKPLIANRNIKITLAGHTDDLGGREYNLALGQKRAEAVKRTLAILGVPEKQMEAISFGEEKPAALGEDEASRAKNRRVEIEAR